MFKPTSEVHAHNVRGSSNNVYMLRLRTGAAERAFSYQYLIAQVTDYQGEQINVISRGGRAGGMRGAAAAPVVMFFGQNAYDSGKRTWRKLKIIPIS